MNTHVQTNCVSNAHFAPAQVILHGRFFLRREGEFPCHTFEMSPSEASLFAIVRPAPGSKVILYLSALGRFTGVATRHTEAGFEMTLEMSQSKRSIIADQLTWYANHRLGTVPERRRHERIVPLRPITVVTLPWGAERVARIRSISLSGVGIEANVWPPINSTVHVGKREAIVVRQFDDGFACVFVKPFEPGELDETVRL